MRDLLDILKEYAALTDAKTLSGGRLPEAQEARFDELKRFYDTLMAQHGLAREPAWRFTASEIEQRVAPRSRLRVQTDLEIVVARGSDFHRARVANLSCGGVLLYCDPAFELGDELTLHMANISRGDGVLPTEGRVVWRAANGDSAASFRHRFGVQFLDLGPDEERSLDAFVVDSLETKLLCFGRDSVDPDFLRREQLSI